MVLQLLTTTTFFWRGDGYEPWLAWMELGVVDTMIPAQAGLKPATFLEVSSCLCLLRGGITGGSHIGDSKLCDQKRDCPSLLKILYSILIRPAD